MKRNLSEGPGAAGWEDNPEFNPQLKKATPKDGYAKLAAELVSRVNRVIDGYERYLTRTLLPSLNLSQTGAQAQPGATPNWFSGPSSTWARHGVWGLGKRLLGGQSAMGEALTLEEYNNINDEITRELDTIFCEATGNPKFDAFIAKFKADIAKAIMKVVNSTRERNARNKNPNPTPTGSFQSTSNVAMASAPSNFTHSATT